MTSNAKQPCYNCPFRIENGIELPAHRKQEILDAITHDVSFNCHKTVNYSRWFAGKITPKSQLCMGAVQFLENTTVGGCRSNLTFRLGIAAGKLNEEDLQTSPEVYQSWEEFVGE